MRPARPAQCFSRKLGFNTRIPRGTKDLIDENARVTVRKRLLHLLRDALHQIFGKSLLAGEQADLEFPLQYFEEIFRDGVLYTDDIGNSAQHCLVRELTGLE